MIQLLSRIVLTIVLVVPALRVRQVPMVGSFALVPVSGFIA